MLSTPCRFSHATIAEMVSSVPFPFPKNNRPMEVVLRKGLEPLCLAAHAPQACVSTNSTT